MSGLAGDREALQELRREYPAALLEAQRRTGILRAHPELLSQIHAPNGALTNKNFNSKKLRAALRRQGKEAPGQLLLHAAAQGDLALCETLILEADASVHYRSNGVEDTALMIAVRRSHLGIAELLLRHGADPNVACSTNCGGYTPLHICIDAFHQAKHAVTSTSPYYPSLHTIPTSNLIYVGTMSSDQQQAGTVGSTGSGHRYANTTTNSLRTGEPCFSSVGMRILLLLLEAYADPNVPDAFGKLPLHDACRCGHATAAQLLLAHGSVVDAVDDAGCTPLDYARRSKDAACCHVVAEMIHARESAGQELFRHAVSRRHGEETGYFTQNQHRALYGGGGLSIGQGGSDVTSMFNAVGGRVRRSLPNSSDNGSVYAVKKVTQETSDSTAVDSVASAGGATTKRKMKSKSDENEAGASARHKFTVCRSAVTAAVQEAPPVPLAQVMRAMTADRRRQLLNSELAHHHRQRSSHFVGLGAPSGRGSTPTVHASSLENACSGSSATSTRLHNPYISLATVSSTAAFQAFRDEVQKSIAWQTVKVSSKKR